MNSTEAKKIAESDLNLKGLDTCKLEKIEHLSGGYWNLIYICKPLEKSKNNIYTYLIDDETGDIVNHMKSNKP
jgi:hypothetical protein